MTAFTLQVGRLRRIYRMLNSLDKEGVYPNITVYNLLRDVRAIVETLIKKAKV